MTPDEIIERGRRAELLLNDPLIKDALAHVTQTAIDKFEEARPSDVTALQEARNLLDGTKTFAIALMGYISEAKNAAAEAEHEPKEVV